MANDIEKEEREKDEQNDTTQRNTMIFRYITSEFGDKMPNAPLIDNIYYARSIW